MTRDAPATEPRCRFTAQAAVPAALGPLRRPVTRLLDRALGLDRLNDVYAQAPHGLDPHNFARRILDVLGVDVHVEAGSLAHVPPSGACIVVANHPHGGLDGLVMIEALMRRRGDVRVMANHLLRRIVELRDTFIGVDPFGGPGAARFNVRAAREALSWLEAGGVLMLFPGGEVSSLDLRSRRIVDPDWDAGVGWLVEKSGAPVVPTFISGGNSLGFLLAGLLHPRLRTALLIREMVGRPGKGKVVDVRCGRRLDADTLALLGSRKAIAPYLQTATYLIQARSAYRKPLRLSRASTSAPRPSEDILPPVDADVLRREVEALPAGQRLDTSGSLEVWYAKSDQIPWLLQEIGRLRELTFRQVGEGTGKRVDLDLFDSYYLHLFVWDARNDAVVGGYRLGQADRILKAYGADGLYVQSLFRLDRQIREELRAALEVGRSFVRPEHQRNYASLMLLWKGIGAYVARHPRYRVLFGPVSISNDYHPLSQQLIVKFLQRTSMEPERSSLVKPRRPFRSARGETRRADLNVSDLRIIAGLLSTVEDEDVGVPVLLRQYLKLNGRILGFNVDPDFNNAIDCLLWVDLARTEPTLLRKYMGADGAARFLAQHGGGAEQNAR